MNQSLEDIEEIRDYIARDSPGDAERFAGRIVASVERLRDYPSSSRIVPEFQDPALREIIVGSYRVIHHVHGDMVAVATVFHTARLLQRDDIPDMP